MLDHSAVSSVLAGEDGENRLGVQHRLFVIQVSGARSVPAPTILGHEIVGHIVDTQGIVSDVVSEPVNVGDRVSWSPAPRLSKFPNHCRMLLPVRLVVQPQPLLPRCVPPEATTAR